MSLKRFLHPRQAPYLFPSPYLLPSFLLCFPPLLSCASFLPSFLPLLLSVLASFSSLFYPPLLLCYLFSSFLLFTSIPVLLSSCFLPSVSYSPLLISYSPLLLFSLFPILRLFFFLKKEKCLPFLLLYFRLCFPSFLPSLLSHRLTSSPIPSFLSSLTSRILPCLMLFSLFPYTPPNRLNNIWQHFRSAPDSASFASLSSR